MSEDVLGDVRRCPCAVRGAGVIVCAMLSAPHQIDFGPVSGGSRPGLTRADVMTAGEVAELLHLPVSTVYYLARQGSLPASRLGRTWRFLRPRIEELLRA